jgi:hypothetical protein
MSQQFATATGPALPAPQPKIGQLDVWLLISVQLVGALLERASGTTAPVWVYIMVNTVLMAIDSRRIQRMHPEFKLGWWVWLAPLYLFLRSRKLGQSQRYLGAWVAAFVAGIAATSNLTDTWNSYWGYGAPSCDGWYAHTRITSLFDTIPLMRDAGIKGTALQPEGEISLANDIRNCRGTVQGSDGKPHPITYTFEWTKDWGVKTAMRLVQ